MTTSYLYRLAFLMLSLLTITACKDDEPAPDPLSLLPPATDYGAETWGAVINGEAAYSADGYYSRIELRSGQDISIYLGTDVEGWESIVLTVREQPINPGTYLLTNDVTASGRVSGPNRLNCIYEYHNLLEGILTITKFDPANERVIAGTFEFTSAKEGCDTLRVRNGRFDIITSY